MYIRTKDNLYEITNKQYDILCGNLTEEEKENFKNITSFGIGSVEEGTYRSVLIKDILKHSENLVELCDGFTYEYCKGSEHERCWRDSNTGKWYDYDTNFKLNEKQILTIKGGIWTEWGLKYVAEMNESGGLKLKWVKN